MPLVACKRGAPMSRGKSFEQDVRSVRGLLAEASLEHALIRLQREHLRRKSWENQIRAPAGQSNGGQWVAGPGGILRQLPPTSWSSLHDGTSRPAQEPADKTERTTLDDGTKVLSIRVRAGRGEFDEQHAVVAPDGESRVFETSGDTQTIRDGVSGEVLSRTTFTPAGLVTEPIVQSAFAPAVPPAIALGIEAIQAARTFELALSLFTVLSSRKDGFGTVLGMTAREYIPAERSSTGLVAWVGQLTQQQLDSTCPRNGEVRALTNEVARAVKASGQYRDSRDLGNKIHIKIAKIVKDMKDPNFRQELLLSTTGLAASATEKGTVRLDLLEHVVPSKTVCIYDYKTGEEGISTARGIRLAAITSKNFPGIHRIIVIQMRPEQ